VGKLTRCRRRGGSGRAICPEISGRDVRGGRRCALDVMIQRKHMVALCLGRRQRRHAPRLVCIWLQHAPRARRRFATLTSLMGVHATIHGCD
jgi:hypothetical protein